MISMVPTPVHSSKAQGAQAPFWILERQFDLRLLAFSQDKKNGGSGPYILFWACSGGVRVGGLGPCILYYYHPRVPEI